MFWILCLHVLILCTKCNFCSDLDLVLNVEFDRRKWLFHTVQSSNFLEMSESFFFVFIHHQQNPNCFHQLFPHPITNILMLNPFPCGSSLWELPLSKSKPHLWIFFLGGEKAYKFFAVVCYIGLVVGWGEVN